MTKDQSKRSLIERTKRNLAWLFSSQISIAAIGLITLAVTARALGAANLGVLALAEAVILIVDRLIHFEPWQAVIKFGTEALENKDVDRFRRLVKFSAVMDVLGGVAAGLTVIALAPFVAPLVGLPENSGTAYLAFLALGLVVALRPTAVAVLRIHDRFDILAATDVGISFVRLVMCLVALAMGAGIWAFLTVLLVQRLLNGIVPFVLAMRELRTHGHNGFLSQPLKSVFEENQGLLAFIWNSNVSVILRQATQRLDTLVLGAMLDLTSVGFYQIGKRIMSNTVKLSGTVRQVLFPEMARLLAGREYNHFWTLFTKVTLAATILSLVTFIAVGMNMTFFVELFFGSDFRDAILVVNILFLTAMTYLATVLFNPAMLSLGLDSALVRITAVSTGAFAVAFVPVTYLLGVSGAALSHLLYNLVWILFSFIALRRAHIRSATSQI